MFLEFVQFSQIQKRLLSSLMYISPVLIGLPVPNLLHSIYLFTGENLDLTILTVLPESCMINVKFFGRIHGLMLGKYSIICTIAQTILF
jgi:hypothetical protein